MKFHINNYSENVYLFIMKCLPFSTLVNIFFFVLRLKDAEKRRNNLLPTFKRNERDRKKLLDTVLKQLRTLSTGAM